MKVVLLNDEDTTDGPKRAGSIIDHPQAELLVKIGKAVPYVEPAAPVEAPAAEADAQPSPPESDEAETPHAEE